MGVMLSVAFGVNILLTFLHVCNVTSVYVDLDHTTCTVWTSTPSWKRLSSSSQSGRL